MELDQSRAPIVEALSAYRDRGMYGFHTPGHKAGRVLCAPVVELLGTAPLELDLPAMSGTDTLLHPTACIAEAQALAAELWGAAATFYLASGSSTGVGGMLLATLKPGDTLVLPRNVHRSVASALVLTGVRPRFLAPPVLPECGALAPTLDSIAAALEIAPKPAAVLLTRPSYYGLAGPLQPIADLCHSQGVPLIVDEAHGAHLRFLPPGHPRSALDEGADLVVQSCHKTLGSLVGAAQVHVAKQSLVSPSQVRDALNLLLSTSPSFLLLLSLDVMRRELALKGEALFARAVEQSLDIAEQIDALTGLSCLNPTRHAQLAGLSQDPTRLVVNVAGTGWTGYEVERLIRDEYQFEDEMADWFNVVLITGPDDQVEARERLIAAMQYLSSNPKPSRDRGPNVEADASLLQPPIPPLAMLPREAALGKKRTISLADSVGSACAEVVTFYPPGIPLLMPGELVTADCLAVCNSLLAAGAHCYASDPTLATLRVVDG